MRKIILNVILVVTLILMCPTMVEAQRFYLEDTDLSVWINEEEWYVFTRNNLFDNPELSEVGHTSYYLHNFMNNNNVYLNGVIREYTDSGKYLELLIKKKEYGKIKNLSNFTDNEVKGLAEGYAEELDAKTYDIYKTNYKYVYLNYINDDYYVVEYYTIINGDFYTITALKLTQFLSSELVEIENIVSSIEFEVDTSLKEQYSRINTDDETSWINTIITTVVFTTLTTAIFSFINKKKNKSNNL